MTTFEHKIEWLCELARNNLKDSFSYEACKESFEEIDKIKSDLISKKKLREAIDKQRKLLNKHRQTGIGLSVLSSIEKEMFDVENDQKQL